LYDYNLVKRANERDYVDIVKSELKFDAKGMKLKLDNLFNGDKLLGKHKLYIIIHCNLVSHILLQCCDYEYYSINLKIPK